MDQQVDDGFAAAQAAARLHRNVDLSRSSPLQWCLLRHGKPIIQYWVKAGKWQIMRTGKTKRGGAEKFAEMIRRGNF